MPDESMFTEALQAINDHEFDRGRELLSRLLRADKKNPEYWLWLSAAVPTQKERIYCLRNVLRIDPENKAAKKGLLLFGEETLDNPPKPSTYIRRDWLSELEKSQKVRSADKPGFFSRPMGRLVSFLAVLAFFIIVSVYSFSDGRGWFFSAPKLTITPVPWTVTPSVTPTPTPRFKTPTPTLEGPIPLEWLLKATHTPTPFYVNTPHPRIEAFTVAMKEYLQEDYSSMLTFMEQAVEADRNSVDIRFYLGEAYRLTGDNDKAMEVYEEAIGLDNNFAPSYLGFAKAKYARYNKAKLDRELETAIELDPGLTEAYLMLADYWNRDDQPGNALNVLRTGEDVLSHIPDYHVLLAETYLNIGEEDDALISATEGLDLDITNLKAYLTLSKAYRANEDYDNALDMVETYLDYDEDSLRAKLVLGSIVYLIGDEYELAEDYLSEVIDGLTEEDFEAYHYRGLTYMELGRFQAAVNDLVVAKRVKPGTFDGNFYLGKALYFTERYSEAFEFVNTSENLAGSDEEFALVFYWRALIREGLHRNARAEDDWERLLELPPEVYPLEWRLTAESRLGLPTTTPTVEADLQETITPEGDASQVTDTPLETQLDE